MATARQGFWGPVLWAFGFYLVLEAGPFFAVGWALRLGPRELAGPYAAFAVPGAILFPAAYHLSKRERRGEQPKRLARQWGASSVLFFAAAAAALCYSGLKLGLMSRQFAADTAIGGVLVCVPVTFLTAYHMTLARLSAKSRGGHGDGSQTP